MADEVTCPICGGKTKPIDQREVSGDGKGYDRPTPTHGKFGIADSVFADRNKFKALSVQERGEAALKRAKANTKAGTLPTILNRY
jgi:hypothetical protein